MSMDPAELRAAAAILWGSRDDPRGAAGLQQFLGVNRRNADYFLSGGKAVGEEFRRDIMVELARAIREDDLPSTRIIRTALATIP